MFKPACCAGALLLMQAVLCAHSPGHSLLLPAHHPQETSSCSEHPAQPHSDCGHRTHPIRSALSNRLVTYTTQQALVSTEGGAAKNAITQPAPRMLTRACMHQSMHANQLLLCGRSKQGWAAATSALAACWPSTASHTPVCSQGAAIC